LRRFFGVSCGAAILLIMIHGYSLVLRHQWTAAGAALAIAILVVGFGITLDAAMARLTDLDSRIGVSFDVDPSQVADFGKIVQERVKALREMGDDFDEDVVAS
jgi:hypothetical protein